MNEITSTTFSLPPSHSLSLSLSAMNPNHQYPTMAPPPQQWVPHPLFPPDPPPSSSFWTHTNLQSHLKDLHQTLILANAMQKELEELMKVKQAKGLMGNEESGDGLVDDGLDNEFSNFVEGNRIDIGAREGISVEAANGLMAKLRFLLEPFRVVTDEGTPWEEKFAACRLSERVKKSKRNKKWRKRKRQRVAEMVVKDRELFEKYDREADEWRAREIAKDIAQQKVEKMKGIAKQKAKEERKKLEAELELALMVEKLQELRSIRIQKLKKQGHFLPEEDNKFLERVQAAAEEEERQAKAAADTDAAKGAIAAAEESRKITQVVSAHEIDESGKFNDKKNQDQEMERLKELDSGEPSHKEPVKGSREQNNGAYNYVASLPPEYYHYYHGSNTDMGTLIEIWVPKLHLETYLYKQVRRTWDAYIRPGGSRIPGHWVQPPPPADEVWASYLLQPK